MPEIDYRAKAAEAWALAEQEANPTMKEQLESIAAIYQRMAEQADWFAKLKPGATSEP